jgi:hypothetical protein
MKQIGQIRVVVVTVTLLAAILVGVGVAYAAPALPQEVPPADEPAADVPGLVEVVTLLAQGLGTGFVLAFLFERFSWFQNMSPTTKWWVVFICSLVLPVLAQIALDYVPPEVWARLEPYWRALAGGFIAWAGSQAAHLGHKALAKAGRTYHLMGGADNQN